MPAGQAGPQARETWGQVGGLEWGQRANLSAFPSFLPGLDGNLQASLRDVPASGPMSLPDTPTLLGLRWRIDQGVESECAGLHVGSELWVMTKYPKSQVPKTYLCGKDEPGREPTSPERLLSVGSRARWILSHHSLFRLMLLYPTQLPGCRNPWAMFAGRGVAGSPAGCRTVVAGRTGLWTLKSAFYHSSALSASPQGPGRLFIRMPYPS